MRVFLVKTSVFLMFATGILQWDLLELEWENVRLLRVFHVIGSIFLALFLITPFIKKHVKYYYGELGIKDFESMVLLTIFILIFISGTYLFLIGNRGGDLMGVVAFNIHLWGSFVLIALFVRHAMSKIGTIVLIFGFWFAPVFKTQLQAQNLTNFGLENGAKRYHPQDWTNSAKCKSCHEDIFNQWSDSNHRHLVGSNPYYMVLETLAAQSEGEEFRQWCMGCHNPSALTTGQKKSSHRMDGNFIASEIFEKNSQTLQEDVKKNKNFHLEEGVSCVACHRITDANSTGNASYSLDLTNRQKYPFEDSLLDLGQWLSEKFINSKPDVHKKSYVNELYKNPKYCASCHDETHPKNGIAIVSTYKEWEKSPFNNPNDPQKHKTCIDCHMTKMENGKFTPLKGVSTDGGKVKNDVKVHYFAGSNHFLAGLKSKEHEDQILQLLRTSAKLDAKITNKKLEVGVTNIGAGHHLPTGVADFREMWLEIEVKDDNNQIIFSSGKLNKDGNLPDDARVFMKVFGDDKGNPVGLLFWKHKKMISDTRIPSKERRAEIFDLDMDELLEKGVKNLEVNIKLNFRIYPQWVTDAVKKMYPMLPNPPVVEIENLKTTFNLKSNK